MDETPFHIGVTTQDLEAGMRDLSSTLGLSWSTPMKMSSGELRHVEGKTLPFRLFAFSREGPLYIELIEGRLGLPCEHADTPLDHLGYWSNDVEGDIKLLENDGWRVEWSWVDNEQTLMAYMIRDGDIAVELIDDAGRSDFAASFLS